MDSPLKACLLLLIEYSRNCICRRITYLYPDRCGSVLAQTGGLWCQHTYSNQGRRLLPSLHTKDSRSRRYLYICHIGCSVQDTQAIVDRTLETSFFQGKYTSAFSLSNAYANNRKVRKSPPMAQTKATEDVVSDTREYQIRFSSWWELAQRQVCPDSQLRNLQAKYSLMKAVK
jgi:hypothetical protein